MKQEKLRVTVLGCGAVGSTVVHLLLNDHRFAMEINIMEPSEHNEGRILELFHCQVLHPHHALYLNDQERFSRADVVFHCAGVSRKIIGSRMEVLKENLEISAALFRNVKFENDPYILVVSNPVDLVAFFVREWTSVSENKVFGTGTLLDSMRMSAAIASHLNLQGSEVQALVVGEHGETMVPLFSQLKIAGVKAVGQWTGNQEWVDTIRKETVFAARKIKQTQSCTYFGVAEAAVRLMDVLLNKTEQFVFCASTVITPELRNKFNLTESIFLSLPLQFSEGKLLPVQLDQISELEWSQWRVSAIYLEKAVQESRSGLSH